MGGSDHIDPPATLADIVEIVEQALAWQKRGRVVDRLGAGYDVLWAIRNEGKGLVTSPTRSGRREQWLALSAHVESLWRDAVRALAEGSHAVATFLALSTIEEVGKLAVAGLELVLRDHGVVPKVVPTIRRRSAFYRHDKKYLVAAASAAVVNARMRRLYGEPWVQQFLSDAEAGRLARLRDTALYADAVDGELLIPAKVIDPNQAALYVATAGELLAEVQVDPAEWKRLIADVDSFRSSDPARWDPITHSIPASPTRGHGPLTPDGEEAD